MADITWTNDKRKLSDLVPWEHNPVQLSKRAADGLQVSIDKFGFAQPLLIGPDGSLYDGHQRQKILDMMADYGPNAEIDVRVSSRPLNEAERQELAIRMRKNTGEFDHDILANVFEFENLLEWGFEPFELGIDDEPLPEFKEYDEGVEDEVEFHECPECGHQWPK